MESRQPRGIRDIAHLYLSGSRAARGAAAPLLVIACGRTRADLSGFHVANLAVALASAGRRACIVERSALVLNAARFLALPPRVYLDPSPNGVVHGALAGVRVTWSGRPAPDEIELVHAPPESAREAHAAVLAEALRRAGGRTPVRVCFGATSDADAAGSGGDGEVCDAGAACHGVAEPDACVAGVSVRSARRPEASGAAAALRRLDVGVDGRGGAGTLRVTHWRSLVADPVPVALRDPDSALARAYASLARMLLRSSPRRSPDEASRRSRPVRRAVRDGLGRPR